MNAAVVPFSRRVLVYSSIGHLMFHFMGVFFFTVVLVLEVLWGAQHHDLVELWYPAAILTAAASLPAGWLGDRWSAPGIMVVFFIGMGVSAIFCAFAPVRDFVWLSIGLGGIGLFGSIYHPVGIPWVMRTAERQGTALGINGVFGSAGNACAGLVVGGLIALVDWRAAFIVPGAISVVLGLALLLDWRRGAVGDRPMPLASGKAPGKSAMIKVFFILMVTMFFAGVIYQATQFALPKLFEVRLDGDIAGLQVIATDLFGKPFEAVFWIGVAVTSVYTASGVMQYVAGRLADRLPLKGLYVACFALQIASLSAVAALFNLPVVVAAMASALLMVGALPAEAMLIGRYTPSRHHGLAFGSKFVLSFAAGPVAIWLIATIEQSTGGLTGVFYVAAALAAGATLAALLLPSDRAAKINPSELAAAEPAPVSPLPAE